MYFNRITRLLLPFAASLGLLLFGLVLVSPISADSMTFTVTKTDDTNDGICNADCSLREAIIAANTNPGTDTIELPAGFYALTIAGTYENLAATGDLDITENIIISGTEATTTIIDGGKIDRVFHIINGNATFSNITIQNGSLISNIENDAGGGIFYASATGGTFNINDSIITGNTISETGTAIFGGGGIAITSSNTIININGCVISNNTTYREGGGILNYAGNNLINVSATTILSNAADGGGGGIYNNIGADINITDSKFISNTAITLGGGGLINVDSDGIIVNISNSTFSGNKARGDSGSGGAIRESRTGSGSEGSVYNITNSTFTDNEARYGGAIAFNPNVLFVTNFLIISNSTFSGNRATYSGGAISDGNDGPSGLLWNTVKLNNVTLVYNTADSDNDGSGDGGGIARSFATYHIANSIIAGNTDNGGEAPECVGEFTSQGYNILSKTDGCNWTMAIGDITGTIALPIDTLLEPLTGDPAYHPLDFDSVAINAGNPTIPGNFPACAATDQRGIRRQACDIGAYEVPHVYLPTILKN